MTLRRHPLAQGDQHAERVPRGMADTESPDLGAAEESDLQRAESDLHPSDPPDTSDDTPTPRETPAD